MNTTTAKKQTKPRVLWAAAIIALGGLLFGYDTGVISGALPSMTDYFHLKPLSSGVVVSSLVVGCAIGAFAAGALADRFGRRLVLIASAVIFVLGALVAAFSINIPMMVIARVILGLGVGVASNIVPMFISELAPPHLRGRLVSLNQLLIVTGIMLAYLANYSLHGISHDWRWMFGLAVIPSLLFGAGILLLDESPRWLALRGQVDEARRVLSSVRFPEEVEAELADIQASAAQEEASGSGFRSLGDRRLRRVLIAGIGLQFLGQLTGVNAVVYYAPSIFESAGLGASAALLATVGVGVVNVLFTFVGMALVDRLGRTKLLATGAFFMAIFLGGLAYVLMSESQTSLTSTMGILCVFGYIASCAATLNVVVFIIASELYPLRVRGAAMSVTLAANWTMSFVVSLTYLTLFEAFGGAGTFGVYALVAVALGFFALLVIPETRGKSLEQIEREYAS